MPLTRKRRTKTDWVLEVAALLEGATRAATLVLDNLNTHTKGAFYKAFEPARARERIEFCYTPQHGSWPTSWRNSAP